MMDTDKLLKKVISSLFDLRRRLAFTRKAANILSTVGKNIVIPAEAESAYRKLWKNLKGGNDTKWLKIYSSVSGIIDIRYVSESVYYNSIEPCLNNKGFSKAYTDKNIYDKLLHGIEMPRTVLRKIGRQFFSSDYIHLSPDDAFRILINSGQFISKPSVESGGGRNVRRWKCINGCIISESTELKSADDMTNEFSADCIFQEILNQNSFYRSFNNTSVNTVRVLTYRSVENERIYVINTVFRVGREGMITDNQASGGYACGVDNNGVLTGFAVDKKSNRYTEVNNVKIPGGVILPEYSRICEKAVLIASEFKYSRLLGLDFCVNSENNPVLIEVNDLNNEINFYQMNGFPLLGDFTDEVISYCIKTPKSFIIDFEI
jgi:hypothetical protein